MSQKATEIAIDAKFWVYGLLFTAVGFIIWKAFGVILIILTAIVIAIFLEGVSKFLTRRKVPRGLAIILVYIFSICLFGFLIYNLIPIFIAELVTLKKLFPQLQGFDGIQKMLDTFTGGQGPSIFEVDTKVLITRLQSSFGTFSSGFVKVFSSVFGSIANTILILVLSLYLALEERAIERLLRIIVPANKEDYVVSLWNRVRAKTESWFLSQLVIALFTSIITFIGLFIMKVPYALLLALLAGIFGMIPFGILVATVPAVLLTLIHKGALSSLYVLGLYWLLQQLTDYVIAPQIVRKATGLPSLMVIISLILSVALLGFLGFFLAIPLALLVLEIVADTEKAKIREQEEEVISGQTQKNSHKKVEKKSDFDINEFERKLVEKLDEE